MSGEVDKWSVEQCRDWLAENAEPWTRKGDRWYHEKWHRTGSGQKRHPIPATLDAAASAMPEGWRLDHMQPVAGDRVLCSAANLKSGGYVSVWGGNELEARFRLAVKARMAGGGGETKA